jgi:hypothetical protein
VQVPEYEVILEKMAWYVKEGMVFPISRTIYSVAVHNPETADFWKIIALARIPD